MTKKLLIVANKCPDWNWSPKIGELKKWFSPSVQFDIDLTHTTFENIPYVEYIKYDAIGTHKYVEGIDETWYDTHIVPLARGYDIVLFVMPLSQWNKKNAARGWRTDNKNGPAELHIWCDEHEQIFYPNFGKLPAFFQIARHELSHALYLILKKKDLTHFWWETGKFENVLLDFTEEKQNVSVLLAQIPILKQILALLSSLKKPTISNRERLFLAARESLGIDVSPQDLVSDSFACVETLTRIIKKVDPTFPLITGTWSLWDELRLRRKNQFTEVTVPQPGDIILSVTGTNSKKEITNGHTGIVGLNGEIMSNDSKTGKFMQNYTLESWRAYYGEKGGFPIYYYSMS